MSTMFRQPPGRLPLEQALPALWRQELLPFSQLDSGGPGAQGVKWHMTPTAAFPPSNQCVSGSVQVALIFSLAQFTVGRNPTTGAAAPGNGLLIAV